MAMGEIERFQCWFEDDHTDLFMTFEDAYEYARDNGCDEIEKLVWETEEAYQNYEMADDIVSIWKADPTR